MPSRAPVNNQNIASNSSQMSFKPPYLNLNASTKQESSTHEAKKGPVEKILSPEISPIPAVRQEAAGAPSGSPVHFALTPVRVSETPKHLH